MEVRLTRHFRDTLLDLAEQGFTITDSIVEDVVLHPDRVDPDDEDVLIAQKGFIARHVLRIAYAERAGVIVCITIYPGRRSRYERSKVQPRR